MPSGQRCLSHGFGSTRAESRQLVSQGDHGQRSIGEHSFLHGEDDVIAVRETKKQTRVAEALLAQQVGMPARSALRRAKRLQESS
jgi:ribosomal protein S4